MPHFVYSTMTAPVKYNKWHEKKDDRGLHKSEKHVIIHGGANLAQAGLGVFHTPKGTVTEVSDEDYAWLKEEKTFQKHIENGFIKVEPKEIKLEQGIENLEPKDKSAPLTEKDLPNEMKDKNKVKKRN